MTSEIKQADEYKERIYATMVRIEKITTLAASSAPVADMRTTAGSEPSTARTAGGAKVKIPKLTSMVP